MICFGYGGLVVAPCCQWQTCQCQWHPCTPPTALASIGFAQYKADCNLHRIVVNVGATDKEACMHMIHLVTNENSGNGRKQNKKKQRSRLPVIHLVEIHLLYQMLCGIKHLHLAGIIHRYLSTPDPVRAKKRWMLCRASL